MPVISTLYTPLSVFSNFLSILLQENLKKQENLKDPKGAPTTPEENNERKNWNCHLCRMTAIHKCSDLSYEREFFTSRKDKDKEYCCELRLILCYRKCGDFLCVALSSVKGWERRQERMSLGYTAESGGYPADGFTLSPWYCDDAARRGGRQ